MDRLGRLWPHAEPVEHTLGRLGARSARAARGGEMSRIINPDDRTFDVDVACRPVRTLHVKDGVSLVVFTTVVPYHPRRPTDLRNSVLPRVEFTLLLGPRLWSYPVGLHDGRDQSGDLEHGSGLLPL